MFSAGWARVRLVLFRPPDYLDEIVAVDVLEHVPDRVTLSKRPLSEAERAEFDRRTRRA